MTRYMVMCGVMCAVLVAAGVASGQTSVFLNQGDNDDFDQVPPGTGSLEDGDIVTLPWNELMGATPEAGKTDVVMRTGLGDVFDPLFTIPAPPSGMELVDAMLHTRTYSVNESSFEGRWGQQPIIVRRVAANGGNYTSSTPEVVLPDTLSEGTDVKMVKVDAISIAPALGLLTPGDVQVLIGDGTQYTESDGAVIDFFDLELIYDQRGAQTPPVPEAGAGLTLLGGLAALGARRKRRN
jgi:MYXO-CTERM domain-containing protein